jgi:tRNA(Ile2) C34 agmatinyltransferase TiaS
MNEKIAQLREMLLRKYSPKQHNRIANGIMFAGVLVNTYEILNNFTSFNWPLVALAVGLVVIGAVYQALIVRCPVCGDKLKGKGSKMMDRCPNCNHDLDKVPQ